MHLEITDFFSASVHILNGLSCGTAYRTHRNDNALRIRRTVVVKDMIIFSGYLVYLLHIFFYDARKLVVESIVCFSELEVYVRILNRVSERRMVWVERTLSETSYCLPVKNLSEIFVGYSSYLLNLVRCSESVKEMHKRNSRLDCGKMRNARKIHNFLNASRGEHCKSCLATVHYIAVVSEDGHRMRSYRSRRNVENRRLLCSADSVKNRNHEHESLRRRKARRKRSRFERTVNGTDRTGL